MFGDSYPKLRHYWAAYFSWCLIRNRWNVGFVNGISLKNEIWAKYNEYIQSQDALHWYLLKWGNRNE
ncbi:hypothetical protein PSKAS_47830 [Peribacillus sp. N1]